MIGWQLIMRLGESQAAELMGLLKAPDWSMWNINVVVWFQGKDFGY